MITALLIIDMQGFVASRTASGRERVNPDAEQKTADLLALFRARGLPVIHVHHDEPGSPVALDRPDGAILPCALPIPGETVLTKKTSSAFTGTGLDAHLRARGIDRLVLAGAVAAFCVTSTTRAAADLGYEVILPSDAVVGFDVPREDGSRIPAATVHDVTLTLLGADFARVMPADSVVTCL